MDVDALSAVLFARVKLTPAPARRVHAVLDGARDPAIGALLASSPKPPVSLFRDAAPELAAVGPWLVELVPGHEWTFELLESSFGRAWGVFCESAVSDVLLQRHLRGFLRVRSPDQKILFFRWYDPRILRLYLPTANAVETRRVAGPIFRYFTETKDGRGLNVDDALAEGFVRTVEDVTKRRPPELARTA